jgi:hypothetical protein
VWQLQVLDFVVSHFTSAPFLSALLDTASDATAQPLQRTYLQFFEYLFAQLKAITEQQRLVAVAAASTTTTTDSAALMSLTRHLHTVASRLNLSLDRLNSLLPLEGFVRVIEQLLTNTNPQIRVKALELLNDKVNSEKDDLSGMPLSVVLCMLCSAVLCPMHACSARPIYRITALWRELLLSRYFHVSPIMKLVEYELRNFHRPAFTGQMKTKAEIPDISHLYLALSFASLKPLIYVCCQFCMHLTNVHVLCCLQPSKFGCL